MKSLLSFIALVGISVVTMADVPSPYADPGQAHAALAAGLSHAKAGHKDVLIVFGANWCEDCRALDKAMHGSSEARELANARRMSDRGIYDFFSSVVVPQESH